MNLPICESSPSPPFCNQGKLQQPTLYANPSNKFDMFFSNSLQRKLQVHDAEKERMKKLEQQHANSDRFNRWKEEKKQTLVDDAHIRMAASTTAFHTSNEYLSKSSSSEFAASISKALHQELDPFRLHSQSHTLKLLEEISPAAARRPKQSNVNYMSDSMPKATSSSLHNQFGAGSMYINDFSHPPARKFQANISNEPSSCCYNKQFNSLQVPEKIQTDHPSSSLVNSSNLISNPKCDSDLTSEFHRCADDNSSFLLSTVSSHQSLYSSTFGSSSKQQTSGSSLSYSHSSEVPSFLATSQLSFTGLNSPEEEQSDFYASLAMDSEKPAEERIDWSASLQSILRKFEITSTLEQAKMKDLNAKVKNESKIEGEIMQDITASTRNDACNEKGERKGEGEEGGEERGEERGEEKGGEEGDVERPTPLNVQCDGQENEEIESVPVPLVQEESYSTSATTITEKEQKPIEGKKEMDNEDGCECERVKDKLLDENETKGKKRGDAKHGVVEAAEQTEAKDASEAADAVDPADAEDTKDADSNKKSSKKAEKTRHKRSSKEKHPKHRKHSEHSSKTKKSNTQTAKNELHPQPSNSKEIGVSERDFKEKQNAPISSSFSSSSSSSSSSTSQALPASFIEHAILHSNEADHELLQQRDQQPVPVEYKQASLPSQTAPLPSEADEPSDISPPPSPIHITLDFSPQPHILKRRRYKLPQKQPSAVPHVTISLDSPSSFYESSPMSSRLANSSTLHSSTSRQSNVQAQKRQPSPFY
ncbi:uncharacterized protein MONOS_12688 [Monocercomonoides exilis]|uniref:uncharacterized protein n=1 Tax=Monocercomonoides exilis TaxID=2049356 RepID=UPI00355A8744|nr:hypothetical protein MONOS_12688 [Monocercomonoides exilis]|eukprot:MONOS_12688.1-p1 / transcript=MONOS_12688.1 / gene=MONOS_12688 / organism=Monocercomonoides_exilis_PA203 / gene_product=unspecified product / transcript_product=unspecified product / location=Mono_scaffold00719:14201-16492(+) / protein_length=764 / sequence_SO=supercontig / SO=protein_coding / is_pseudo=false